MLENVHSLKCKHNNYNNFKKQSTDITNSDQAFEEATSPTCSMPASTHIIWSSLVTRVACVAFGLVYE